MLNRNYRKDVTLTKFSVFLCTFLVLLLAHGIAGATLVDMITFGPSGIVNDPDGGVPSSLDSWGGSYVNKIENLGDSLWWTHNFDISGWAGVSGGTLSISLIDNDSDRFFWNWEFALGFGEDWSFDIGEVDTGVSTYSIAGTYLDDGAYSLAIIGLGGDFFVDYAKLEIDPVPEPATMLLLGSGLAGLAGFGRKKFFKKK